LWLDEVFSAGYTYHVPAIIYFFAGVPGFFKKAGAIGLQIGPT